MRIRKLMIGLSLFLGIGAGEMQGQQGAVDRFVATKGFEHASVGLSVIRLSDGKAMASYGQERSLVPASVQKAITTATALRLLGDTCRIPTCVAYSGRIVEGVLRGDLIIRGGGDPSLGSKYDSRQPTALFQQIGAALKSEGITAIAGRIIGDESALDQEGIVPGWSWEDMGNYYAAGVYGLNYRDNLYELLLDTSEKGKKPIVKGIKPAIDGLRIHNMLLPVSTSFDSAYLYGAPFSGDRFLYGAVPHKGAVFTVKGDMPEPALQTAQLAADYLKEHGFGIAGGCESYRTLCEKGETVPRPAKQLLCFYSEPLRELARQTNVHSINLFAEGLLRQIGLAQGVGSTQEGIGKMIAYWKGRGLDTSGLFLYDGSGLSPSNRVTASFLTALMREMKDERAFVSSLPVAGVEGTVGSFLRATPLRGKARLKSGTIKQVISYTGYIDGKERYAMAVLVNNASCSNREVRRAIEKMLVEMNL